MRIQIAKMMGILLLLSSASGHALNSKRIVLSTNNLGTAFNTTFPQLALTGIPNNAKGVYVYNGGASTAECYLDWPYSTKAPSADTGNGHYVPAGFAMILDFKGVAQQVFCRCTTTCTTGEFIVEARLQ